MAATVSDFDRAAIGSILMGEGDWFSARLIRLISKSDRANRELLRRVYPDHVKLVEEYIEGPQDS